MRIFGIITLLFTTPFLGAQTAETGAWFVSAMQAAQNGPEAFNEALEKGRSQDIPNQRILEARLLYPIRSGDFSSVDDLLESLKVASSKWDYSNSLLFKSQGDLQAVIHLYQAQQAYTTGDTDNFRKHATEAFWLEPDLGRILGQWIDRHRQEIAMKDIRLPMDTRLSNYKGETVSLEELVKGQKAILIDFWASWCAPCMQNMPLLKDKAEKLRPQSVVVAGLNTEDVAKAESYHNSLEIDFPWLVEPGDRPYSRILQIDTIPRMVLISPEGEILFNGHPMDTAGLSAALAKLGVKL